uniref:Helicase ATP-binding domain-containing protein n=1 Tax=Parastrongyloides trichosuri TaxID=131310 RepID=A0A0N4ZKQ6_PARTI
MNDSESNKRKRFDASLKIEQDSVGKENVTKYVPLDVSIPSNMSVKRSRTEQFTGGVLARKQSTSVSENYIKTENMEVERPLQHPEHSGVKHERTILGDDKEYYESEGEESSSSEIINVDVDEFIEGSPFEFDYDNVRKSTLPVGERGFFAIDTMVRHFEQFDPDVIVDQHSKLKTKLMYNQMKNIHFMIHREKSEPFSGILADEMGLGKTLSVIAFILYQRQNDSFRVDYDGFMVKGADPLIGEFYEPVESRATLIVVPAIVLKQWQDEVKKHVGRGGLKCKVYDPKNQKKIYEVEDLLDLDIVFTTYDVVKAEYRKIVKYETLLKKRHSMDEEILAHIDELKDEIKRNESTLAGIYFRRLVLDEVHAIKRPNTILAKACCHLNGIKRWAVTGTPVQNTMGDFYSILKFLKVAPFDLRPHFNDITTGRSEKKMKAFNELVRCILIRSEKDLIDPRTKQRILDIPKRNIEDIHVRFGGLERRCYERMFYGMRKNVGVTVADMIERNGDYNAARVRGEHIEEDGAIKMSLILSFTTRLRQACCHMNMVSRVVDFDRLKPAEQGQEVTEYNEKAIHLMGSTQALEEEKDENASLGTTLKVIFSKEYQSAKIRAVLEKVKIALERGDKCIIVSQWTMMLDIFAGIFEKQGVRYEMITGRDPIPVRDERIETLNNDPNGPKIYLLSLLASGIGVNLTGANHMFLTDLFWNPAVEKQCFDRIYRFGQTKETFVYRFVCNSSLEEKVLDVQKKKEKLAFDVLCRKLKKNIEGYGFQDVRTLYNV